MNINGIYFKTQRLLHLKADSIRHCLSHCVNACAIFNDDMDLNIKSLAAIVYSDPARRVTGDRLYDTIRKIPGSQPHHAIGLQCGMIYNGCYCVWGDVYPAKRCNFVAHNYPQAAVCGGEGAA